MTALASTEAAPRRRTGRDAYLPYALPALALLVVIFVFPVLGLLLRSVTEPEPGLQNYAELFATTTYARVLFNTFLVAALVTLVTALLAYPVAWLLAVMPGRWQA